MATVTDDLGVELRVSADARRVVSLVPSLTESIAATRRDALVAATDWCTHPADLAVERIRGTKNPNVARIVELQPDLVVANQEENRKLDVDRLRAAGISVWVTVTEDVTQALDSLGRMFTLGMAWPEPEWLTVCRRLWSGPVPPPRLRVAIPIWREPWMVVGGSTFTSDLAARCGLANVFDDVPRYPRVELDEIRSRGADLVLLPDEPYRFTAGDGPESFPSTRTALVDGRALTWYGPSLLTAHERITGAVAAAR